MLAKNRTTTAFVIALIVGVAGVVVAAGPGTPPNIIPYRGHLDIAGAPFNGTASITFHLYDDADPAQSTLNWDETLMVTVQQGGFGVLLGQNTSIPNAALDSADLYLGIDVEGTPLVGTQRIVAAPMAVRADRAYALDVETDATVGGQVSASVVSATTVSGGTVSGSTVSATASVTAPTLTANTTLSAPTGNITNVNSTNVNSTNGDINQLDTTDMVATSSVVSAYARARRVVVRRDDQDVFNNGNAYRNMELRTRFSANPQQGSVTCAVQNEFCLACFTDSNGGGFVACNSIAGNKNCLCVGPE